MSFLSSRYKARKAAAWFEFPRDASCLSKFFAFSKSILATHCDSSSLVTGAPSSASSARCSRRRAAFGTPHRKARCPSKKFPPKCSRNSGKLAASTFASSSRRAQPSTCSKRSCARREKGRTIRRQCSAPANSLPDRNTSDISSKQQLRRESVSFSPLTASPYLLHLSKHTKQQILFYVFNASRHFPACNSTRALALKTTPEPLSFGRTSFEKMKSCVCVLFFSVRYLLQREDPLTAVNTHKLQHSHLLHFNCANKQIFKHHNHLQLTLRVLFEQVHGFAPIFVSSRNVSATKTSPRKRFPSFILFLLIPNKQNICLI
jgi:hypothetical protein